MDAIEVKFPLKNGVEMTVLKNIKYYGEMGPLNGM